jgi:hypothetical protein
MLALAAADLFSSEGKTAAAEGYDARTALAKANNAIAAVMVLVAVLVMAPSRKWSVDGKDVIAVCRGQICGRAQPAMGSGRASRAAVGGSLVSLKIGGV